MMCGRYTIDDSEREIAEIIQEVIKKHPGETVKTGEIRPTNTAPVLLDDGGTVVPDLAKWGYPDFRGSGGIINARAETAIEKKTFRASLLARRCVIPSTGFFEWKKDASKQKYLFQRAGSPLLYMAGIYNDYDGVRRYVILTTDANPSVADVHNRMPVVIKRDEVADWIQREDAMLAVLHREPPQLTASPVQ